MPEPQIVRPKVFISYAWVDDEYKEWVANLGKRLMEDEGIEVILDQWSLKHGHNAFAFMERMVTDPEVKKVLCLCEPKYCEKANANEGGAGIEKTIFSAEVYGKVAQEKFIPVITRLAEDGTAPVPVPLKGLYYFDFSDANKLEANFEHLARNIWEKPLTKPPLIGPPPAYVYENLQPTVAPYARELRVFIDAAEKGNNPRQAKGHAKAFVKKWVAGLETLVIREKPDGEVVEDMLKRLDAFETDRADFVRFLARGIDFVEGFDAVADVSFVLQTGLNIMQRQYSGYIFDEGLKYALRDLVVVTTALLLEHPQEAAKFFKVEYVEERRAQDTSLIVVDWYLERLTNYSHRKADEEGRGHWMSVQGQEAKKRAHLDEVDFPAMIQADFVLSLRFPELWCPRYIPYAGSHCSTFPVFRRAAQDTSTLFTLLDVKIMKELIDRVQSLGSRIHQWTFRGDIDLRRLANLARLTT